MAGCVAGAALLSSLIVPATALAGEPTELDASAGHWSMRTVADTPRIGELVLVANEPGGRTSVELTVENPGDKAVTVAVSTAAVSTDGGALAYTESDSVLDPVNWVAVPQEQQRITVPPGESAAVTVTVRTPTAATGGDYAAGVTAVASDTGERRAVPLLVRVPGSRPSGLELADADALQTQGTAGWPLTGSVRPIRYRVVNTGTTVVAGQLSVGLATVFDRFAVVDDVGEVVLLPGDEVTGTVTGTVPPSGPVALEARVRVGYLGPDGSERSYLVQATGPSTFAFPWWLSAAALTVLTVTTAGWATARRRRIRALGTAPRPRQPAQPDDSE